MGKPCPELTWAVEAWGIVAYLGGNATAGWEPWEPPGVPFGGPRKRVSLRFARRNFAPERFLRQWQIARFPKRLFQRAVGLKTTSGLQALSMKGGGDILHAVPAPPPAAGAASRLKRRGGCRNGRLPRSLPTGDIPPQRDQPDRVRLIPKRKPVPKDELSVMITPPVSEAGIRQPRVTWQTVPALSPTSAAL